MVKAIPCSRGGWMPAYATRALPGCCTPNGAPLTRPRISLVGVAWSSRLGSAPRIASESGRECPEPPRLARAAGASTLRPLRLLLTRNLRPWPACWDARKHIHLVFPPPARRCTRLCFAHKELYQSPNFQASGSEPLPNRPEIVGLRAPFGAWLCGLIHGGADWNGNQGAFSRSHGGDPSAFTWRVVAGSSCVSRFIGPAGPDQHPDSPTSQVLAIVLQQHSIEFSEPGSDPWDSVAEKKKKKERARQRRVNHFSHHPPGRLEPVGRENDDAKNDSRGCGRNRRSRARLRRCAVEKA